MKIQKNNSNIQIVKMRTIFNKKIKRWKKIRVINLIYKINYRQMIIRIRKLNKIYKSNLASNNNRKINKKSKIK